MFSKNGYKNYLLMTLFGLAPVFVLALDLSGLEDKAQSALESGDDGKAILMYERLTQLDSDNAENFMVLARLYTQYGQWQKITDAAQNILTLLPNDKEALQLVTSAHIQLKQWPQATQLLDQLTTSYASDPWAYQHYAIVLAEMGKQPESDAMRNRYLELVGSE